MKILSTLAFVTLVGLLACKDCDQCQCPEPNYEYDPSNPKYICKAPEIAKNIVGSWKYESNISYASKIRTGYVTFDASNRVIDPDSLFENRLEITTERDSANRYIDVIAKTYAIKDGKVEVYQFRGATLLQPVRLAQTYPLKVKENSCNRIELILGTDDHWIKLTR